MIISSEIYCPGCNVEITLDNAGGYRCFCQQCVDAMPEFPKDGKGHVIEGKYPNFKWLTFEYER